MSSTADAPRRTRDPEAKRAAILAAARSEFAERGFAKATIREIARRAGVANGLVLLHFTSKEQLFMAAVPGPRDLAGYIAGDLDGLPDRLARSYVARMESADGADPFVALVRAAADDRDTAKRLLIAMRDASMPAYRAVMTGDDVEERVELGASLMIGVTLNRYVLAEGVLAGMDPERFTGYLASALRGILLG